MRLVTFPVACNVLMTARSAIITHVFKNKMRISCYNYFFSENNDDFELSNEKQVMEMPNFE